jgi:O-glycosyl hydrolase
MKAALLAPCILTAALCAAGPRCAAYTVIVDPTQRFQTFEGWGTSLAWMGKAVGDFPDPARDTYMDLIFDRQKGLGLNVVRYNIGGGENPSLHLLSSRAAMDGFEPAPGQWNWNADAGQRWVLQQAIARGANLVEAFSNSPPYWMTNSGSVSGARDGSNNLSTRHWSEFASYLATVTQHFHDAWGITFRTLEPFNEPVSGWWKYGGRQEGCHFFQGSNQTSIIQILARELAAKNLSTTVSAPDENSIDDALKAIREYDSQTLARVSQFNTHSYHGAKRTQLYQLALSDRKRLWMSEYGDADASGITLAMQINRDMNHLHPGAWVYWQVVDKGSGWSMLHYPENGGKSAVAMNEKYWVYANFTKFITPGAVIIGSDDSTCSLLALDAGRQTLTMVTTNQGDAVQTITYDLSRVSFSHPAVAAYQTSAHQQLLPLPAAALSNNLLTFVVPGASVTTVVVSGVTSP